MEKTRVIIMGAAGRDFHNFNTVYRDDDRFEVVAFTATQIPDIEGRRYPPELAGKLYPEGIKIFAETDLTSLIRDFRADVVAFSYSDVNYPYVMSHSAVVNAAGADFVLIGTAKTLLKSSKPVVAICAVRTGCGKSQTTRRVCEILKASGKRVAAVRHPMPYGDLAKQRVQRFAAIADLDRHECTIEEREEYEPHIESGTVIFAGVDYEAILRDAEKEADVVVWDGGNNDLPFYRPDLHIVVTDPHRTGDELYYYPGEANLRMAHVVVINKIDTADHEDVLQLRRNIKSVNPNAVIVDGASPIRVSNPEAIRNKRVLVVEDGPTLTHGEMKYGAGTVAAEKFGAAEIVDPRPFTVGRISETFEKYPEIGMLLPAMGYGDEQIKDLESTINQSDCDSVVIGTPIDLRKLIDIKKETARVYYDLQEIGKPDLGDLLKDFLERA